MTNRPMTVPTGFARLLATENIVVRVDNQAHTATFDTASRVLTMPNWDCSERMRDMLIGHECAHAIFTDDGGDIVKTVTERVGSNFAIAKDYLNVVEDIRIDRLIQRRYAGLRRDYAVGYREMREKDFFGVGDRDLASLPFIDRLNLHFKGFAGDIEFSPEEMVFVNRCESAESFDDACDIARDLYNHSDSNGEGNQQQIAADLDENEEGEGIEAPGNGQQDENGPKTEGGNASGDNGDSGEGKGTANGDTEGDSDDDGTTAESVKGGEGESNGDRSDDLLESSQTFAKTGDPSTQAAASVTQRNAEKATAATAKVDDNPYAPRFFSRDLPRHDEIDLDRIIYTYREILDACEGIQGYDSKWQDFQRGAKATVTNLAQMFERKKAAAIARRTQVAKTGRLDMTALHKYKMTEDLFLRNKVEIKGKNHGLIAFIDWSGSMCDCMEETIAQTIILAMFCKKVGIPFRIYGFSTYTGGERSYYGSIGGNIRRMATGCFTHDRNTDRACMVSDFSLIEIFSDKMKKADFDRMASLLLLHSGHNAVPICLGLGGTPLNESIVAASKIALKFRKEYGIDVLNSIWITDGGDGDPFGYGPGVVNDRDTGRVYNKDNSVVGTNLLFRIYKDRVGGNLIGFFLDSKKSIESTIYYGSHGTRLGESFKKDRFVQMPHDGYDIYFLMDKKIAVYTSSDKMDALPDHATATRVINAFRKDLGTRAMSRPLLNAFTDRIAKEIV